MPLGSGLPSRSCSRGSASASPTSRLTRSASSSRRSRSSPTSESASQNLFVASSFNVSPMRLRVGVALLLIVVAAAAVNYLRPIPAVAPTHLLKTSEVVPGTAPALPWPSRGSAAVGVSGLGLVASSGNEQAIPAASVTKVMTALVILFDDPLVVGAVGPGVTVTAADVQAYQNDLAQGQSVARVEDGE